ncbi:MAG: hypothetical protein ACXVIY_00975 [Mucilaginibacter sp.]
MRRHFIGMLGLAAIMSAVSAPSHSAVNQPLYAENKSLKDIFKAQKSTGSNPWRTKSHANNIQIKHKHTNRLHSRKQAKLRAKRKSR